MTRRRTKPDELAAEAGKWSDRSIDPRDWSEAPDAVPRAQESVAISLRVPGQMLAILRELARRQGIGYQVLIKRWLDERIAGEREALKRSRDAAAGSGAAEPAVAEADLVRRVVGELLEQGVLAPPGRLRDLNVWSNEEGPVRA